MVMLKGSSTATFDKFGRVGIPAKFRKIIEEKYGKEVFITSFDLKNIRIYPLAEWENITSGIGEKMEQNPKLRRFMLGINRLGMKTEMDKHGRLMIHKLLRDKINLEGRIVVEGRKDHLVLKKA